VKKIHSDYDPDTGITEESWYDEMEGTLTLRRLQDVEATLGQNKSIYNMYTGKKPTYADSDGMHKVAHIPFMVIEKWLREDGFDWYKSSDTERRAYINANPKLKVRPGKL